MRLEDLPEKLQAQAREKLGLTKSKYHAQRTEVDGIMFDSKFESEHYASLKLLERAGIITDLKLQPRYILQEAFEYQGHRERKIEYIADFEYTRNGEKVVEECKSPATRTQVYMLKRKLFLHKYGKGIVFREVYKHEENKSR